MCEDIIPCFDNNRTPSSRETVAKLQLINGGFVCKARLFFHITHRFIYKRVDEFRVASQKWSGASHMKHLSQYCYKVVITFKKNPLDNKRQMVVWLKAAINILPLHLDRSPSVLH